MQLFSFYPSSPKFCPGRCVSPGDPNRNFVKLWSNGMVLKPNAENDGTVQKVLSYPNRTNYFDPSGPNISQQRGHSWHSHLHVASKRSARCAATGCCRPCARTHIYGYTCTCCIGLGEVSPNAAAKLGIRQLLPG